MDATTVARGIVAAAALALASACATEPGLPPGALEPGIWGSSDVGMVVTDTATSLVFACAVGRIPGPLVLDRQGIFNADGIYAYTPGPLYVPHDARYHGVVSDGLMSLTVMVAAGADTIAMGPYRLIRGVQGPTGPLCL